MKLEEGCGEDEVFGSPLWLRRDAKESTFANASPVDERWLKILRQRMEIK